MTRSRSASMCVHDVANAHQSTTFSPAVDFRRRCRARPTPALSSARSSSATNMPIIISASRRRTRLRLADTAGVRRRRRDEGLEGGLLLNQSITGDLLHGLSVFGTGRYSRLVGDFKRSPIVSQRGSANQWLAAAGLAYTLVSLAPLEQLLDDHVRRLFGAQLQSCRCGSPASRAASYGLSMPVKFLSSPARALA